MTKSSPSAQVSIDIVQSPCWDQQNPVLGAAANEIAKRELAGIIQGLKLLKYRSGDLIGLENIEAPEKQKDLITGLEKDLNGIRSGQMKIKLGEGRQESSIIVNRENMKKVSDLLNLHSKDPEWFKEYDGQENKELAMRQVFSRIESGLDEMASQGPKFCRPPQARRR